MASRSRLFSKIAKDVGSDGNLTAAALSSDVSFGATVYDSTGVLPYIGNSTGDQAYVKDNNRFYIWDSSGWYNVALINRAPTISSVQDPDGASSPFALSTNGTATTITITATDSDGDLITYSAVTDANFDGLASITGSGNEFTVTPFSSDSATTQSGTITFKATDGINISSNISTFTLNFLSALWADVTLSIGTSSTNSLDNSTFIDRSSNAHTVTTEGTPIQTAFHPYLENWSVEFDDAVTGSLKYNYDTAINVGSGDYTIELWCYAHNLNTHDAIFNIRAGDSGFGFLFRKSDASGNWEAYTGNGSPDIAFTDSASPLNAWVHHAFVRINGTLKWYINGVEELSQANSATWSTYTQVQIGNYNTAYTWPGYISNLRIVKGTGVYTGAFTPPTEKLTAISGTVLLACNSNRFDAAEGTYDSYAVAGTAKISASNPFGQESEYTAGENKGSVSFNNNYLSTVIASSSIGSTYTIEFWYKFDATSTIDGNHYLLDARTSGQLYLYRSSATTYASPGQSWALTDSNFNDGIWHYFVIACDGTNLTIWLDGSRLDTRSDVRTLGTNLYLNARYSGTNNNVCNYSDVRVSTVARYAYTETTIAVPTAPLGTDANTSVYLPMDNAGIFDKTGNATLVPNTSTATSTTQTKYDTTSINFPTNSTLSVLYEPWMNISDQDFTMEMWVYPTDSSGGILWSFGYSADNRLDFGWQSSGGIRLLIETSNVSNTVFTSSDAVSTYLNSWVHIAVVRVGAGFTLYVNGTSTATGTSSLSIVEDTTDGWTFGGREFSSDYTGGNPSDPFTGYLENIQFFKTAKYTSNFTVPSQEQGRTYQAED